MCEARDFPYVVQEYFVQTLHEKAYLEFELFRAFCSILHH